MKVNDLDWQMNDVDGSLELEFKVGRDILVTAAVKDGNVIDQCVEDNTDDGISDEQMKFIDDYVMDFAKKSKNNPWMYKS